MGVSIDSYRSRIGLFHGRCVRGPLASSSWHPSSQQINSGTHSISLKLIPAATLLFLLFIGGIEPNPGPDRNFTCKYCNLTLSSVSDYCRHIVLHKGWKNFSIPCFVKNCCRELKNLTSLQSHVTRFHDVVRQGPTQVLNILCPVPTCFVKIESRKEYAKHMAGHLDQGISFKCVISGCGKNFDVKKKFQNHMSRYHPGSLFDSAPTDHAESAAGDAPSVCDVSLHQDSDDEGDRRYGDLAEDPCFEEGTIQDPYPEFVIKDEIAKFYLELEAEFVLPTSTVQVISENVKKFTEFSHHCLKLSLREALKKSDIDEQTANDLVRTVFKSDPVFNVHHKHEDVEQFGTDHMRTKYWHSRFPFVQPEEINLGCDESGKKKRAHYVPIRETLNVLLKDPKIKSMVLNSFHLGENSSSILTDYTDGTAFKEHKCQHEDGKCLQLLLFEDAFEFNAFGPSAGLYKPVGFYYSLGNIRPEYRSKVDLIQLVYMVLEKHTTNTERNELEEKDALKNALQPLLTELKDLKINGLEVDGKKIPVCLMYLLGDNLGQHTVGRFVKSFVAEFFCRFCEISRTQFLSKPYDILPFRTSASYDEGVILAKHKWDLRKKQALQNAKKKAFKRGEVVASRCSAPSKRVVKKTSISKSAYKKLCAINYRGVKYQPSPFNSKTLKFHVCSPPMAPCLAHDLYEGCVKVIVAKVLQYFADKKSWFDLDLLNRRIKTFKCKSSDLRDRPKPLKSFDALNGNACENWNLVRLLPFIIGDLIKDPEDEVFQIFLSLKEICEFVCAPKISLQQISYLRILIKSFISRLKKNQEVFPKCITPKLHYLCHYPDLIEKFGPLIRLFTLRYESRHVFFKRVVRACKNYINITHTLAKKYMCRFAYDHMYSVLGNDIVYDSSRLVNFDEQSAPQEKLRSFPSHFNYEDVEVMDSITIHGTTYEKGLYLVISAHEDSTDIRVGCIDSIFLNSVNKVSFMLKVFSASNSFHGYFVLKKQNTDEYQFVAHQDLLDFYPLPSYQFQGDECLTLKHSVVYQA